MGAVRRATLDDLPAVVEMAKAFHSYSPWRDVEFDAEAVATFISSAVEFGGAVFINETGMCGGIISPMYFNPSVKMATEIVWWAPDGGRELREAFEAWAVESGAHTVAFSALYDDRIEAVSRIYRRSGFQPVETTFLKRL